MEEITISKDEKKVAAAAVEFEKAGQALRDLQRAGRVTTADVERAFEAERKFTTAKEQRDLRKGVTAERFKVQPPSTRARQDATKDERNSAKGQ